MRKRTRLYRAASSVATSSVAKLNSPRTHPVERNLRATMGIVEVLSDVRLELSSHSSHRLGKVSYLLLAQRVRLEPLT